MPTSKSFSFTQNLGRSHIFSRLDHPPRRDPQGALRTSLPSDLFSLIRTETSVLQDLFVQEGKSPSSKEAHEALTTLMGHVQQVHESNSQMHLHPASLEDCCAAANDCMRMAENMEKYIEDVREDPGIELDASELIRVWSQDAVAAAGRTQVFTSRQVQSAAEDFFSKEWEEEWTRNEVSLGVVETFDTMLNEVEDYLASDYLYHKAVGMSVKALICFYIRCVVNKADKVLRRNRNRVRFIQEDMLPFQNHQRALRRMADDIAIFKEFCERRCEGSGVLRRVAFEEMYILDLIRESLGATELDSLESFILVLHKRTGADMLVTRYFVGDLWTLMIEQQHKSEVQKTVQELHPDLVMLTKGLKERAKPVNDDLVHMDLGHMLKAIYEDRVAQGVVPACYPCLPKIPLEGGDILLPEHIRLVTRKVEEMKYFAKRWKK